jgi:hypothetical protein
VFTHELPHVVVPAPQVAAHLPALQTSPPLHAVPHAPQFAPSDFVSTHDEAHFVVPPPQPAAHAPAEQTSPAPHFFPQAPQFSASRAITVQLVPQTCDPSPQLTPASTGV